MALVAARASAEGGKATWSVTWRRTMFRVEGEGLSPPLETQRLAAQSKTLTASDAPGEPGPRAVRASRRVAPAGTGPGFFNDRPTGPA